MVLQEDRHHEGTGKKWEREKRGEGKSEGTAKKGSSTVGGSLSHQVACAGHAFRGGI